MKSHKDENIHFIGVGGASMSALAKFVVNRGGNVTGSDRERTSITEELERIFPVYYGEYPEIIDGCDR
ncbi:MAG: UDP-N-acetylmuramate--L-alanine ligase, partial [Clostridia bacterium]|nr:UDP-N-acetylmuramate--L-alanine ligase [Clostridia bacterium]